jgi:hypothetical protein
MAAEAMESMGRMGARGSRFREVAVWVEKSRRIGGRWGRMSMD